jgi:RNA recognition motif-containing protein
MNIYVGNLPRDTSEAEIRSAFEAFGEVSNITMVMEKYTNTFKGFCFIEMPKKEDAEKAMGELNESDFGGRTLTVNEAKPKTDKPKRYSNSY